MSEGKKGLFRSISEIVGPSVIVGAANATSCAYQYSDATASHTFSGKQCLENLSTPEMYTTGVLVGAAVATYKFLKHPIKNAYEERLKGRVKHFADVGGVALTYAVLKGLDATGQLTSIGNHISSAINNDAFRGYLTSSDGLKAVGMSIAGCTAYKLGVGLKNKMFNRGPPQY